MARIAGVEISDTAKVDWALTRIRGIGWTRSREILKTAGIESKRALGDLSAEELSKIAAKLEDYVVEGDLVRQIRENIQRLREINSYRGLRHVRGLPTRGQRTRSNARTRRGKRKTVGSFRKEMLTKMQTDKKVEV